MSAKHFVEHSLSDCSILSNDPSEPGSYLIRMFKIQVLSICLVASMTSPALSKETGVDLRIVAHTGQIAPGTPEEATFSNGGFSAPVINASGGVAFQASLLKVAVPQTTRGIWAEDNGVLDLLIRQADEAPGTSEVFESFTEIRNNNQGQVAFRGRLRSVSGDSDIGIWTTGSDTLSLVAREGDMAPIIGENFVFFGPTVFNNAGQTAFAATVTGSVGTFTIWSEGTGSLGIVARNSTSIPIPEDDFLAFKDPSLNDLGNTVFWAQMSGAGDWSIWSQKGGAPKLLARQLQLAPGSSDPVTGDPQAFSTFHGDPVINNANRSAFGGSSGAFNSNLGGVWKEGSGEGGLTLVARETSVAPGTTNGFSAFRSPVMNAEGHIAIFANLSNATVFTDAGFWSESSGALDLVLREGDPAPRLPMGVKFRFNSPTSFIPAFNANGYLAFIATVEGPGVDGSNNVGVWLHIDKHLFLVIRSGDLIEIESDNFKMITGIRFIAGSGNQDGRPTGFSDSGKLAMLINYIGGQAIVVAEVDTNFIHEDGFETE